MSYMHPAAVEHLRKRWTRPDAYRFAPPGSPKAREAVACSVELSRVLQL